MTCGWECSGAATRWKMLLKMGSSRNIPNSGSVTPLCTTSCYLNKCTDFASSEVGAGIPTSSVFPLRWAQRYLVGFFFSDSLLLAYISLIPFPRLCIKIYA